MTVSYQYEVASSTSGGFTRLLFMWRGSLYKLIYRELLLFLLLFAAISTIYRYVLTKPHKRFVFRAASSLIQPELIDDIPPRACWLPLGWVDRAHHQPRQQRRRASFLFLFFLLLIANRISLYVKKNRKFEQIVVWCDTFISLIPLSFVLGFYVAYVAARWWQQYIAIPWPDKVMHLVALYVTGNDEYGRMLRRALMRYLNLSLILVLRSISSAVKRRFPTLDHVVDYGFMTSLELDLFQSVPSLEFNTYWIPCTWFINLLKEARRSHRLPDAQGLKIIMEEFNDFRSKCGLLWSYDWVSIPLVYTQVVTLATYSFFVVALVGRQYIEGAKKPFQMEVDAYLPIFTILQFFFYMGLLKVAEQLINPFGDDDEDFELNWLIDRHTKVSYLGVDTLMNRCPPLVKDIFYDAENVTLPYTEAAAAYKRKTYRGSVANMTVPEEKQTMFLPDITEEEEDSKASTTTPRTSTASAVHFNESPINGRRQISGSPSTTHSRMARNVTETIVQLDLQEINQEIERADRRAITKAMKMTPTGAGRSSNKCSTPRLDQNRKPFFTGPKAARQNLQPWPSATNLLRLAANQHQQHATAEATTSFTKRDKDSENQSFETRGSITAAAAAAAAKRPPFISISRHDLSHDGDDDDDDDGDDHQGEEDNAASERRRGAFVNSAFSQEYISPGGESGSSPACQCCDDNSYNKPDEHTDVCKFQCHHDETCQHEDEPTDYELPQVELGETAARRRRLNSCPKLLIRRQSSTESHKKWIRWRRSQADDSLIRRKTVDSVPSDRKIIPQTSSSPNLKSWPLFGPPSSSVVAHVAHQSKSPNCPPDGEKTENPDDHDKSDSP